MTCKTCHPERSVSEVEGSTAAGSRHGSARIPPLRFAPVGMTYRGTAVAMTYMPVIPSVAQRSRGIYRSWFEAWQCQDSSTSLRSGRNDIKGGSSHRFPRSGIPSGSPTPCHPDWSVSEMEGSSAPDSMQGSARIPPLRFAPVVMTWAGGCGSRNDITGTCSKPCGGASSPLKPKTARRVNPPGGWGY